MLDFAHITNLVLLVMIVILLQPYLYRWHKQFHKHWKSFKQRQCKPASPHDCHLCCHQVNLRVIQQRSVVPYHQTKSPRGRKKSVSTRHFACPNPNCDYCGITDKSVHALVGYGHHNRIPRFKCQACGKVFTSRIGTPFYYLKTSKERVNLTFRQCVSCLSRRTWAYAQSKHHLLMHCEWLPHIKCGRLLSFRPSARESA